MKNQHLDNTEGESKLNKLSLLQNMESLTDSHTFLEQCTYFIGLTDLYQFHSTCYYNETMLYAPVQVKIVHPKIQESYNGAKIMLQVWKRGGKKIFERHLQDEVQIWTVCYQYFIYKPSVKDGNSDYFHIVDLSNNQKTFLVKDFSVSDKSPIIAFSNNMLYLANDSQIKVASLNLQDNSAPIEPSQDDIFTITLENENHDKTIPCKLLALIVHKYAQDEHPSILACIESVQSCVDFSFLKVKRAQSLNSNEKFVYEFDQFREIILGKGTNNDRIVRFDFVVTAKDEFVQACAQKASGAYDVYYNAFRVSTSDKVLIKEFDLTFDTLYLNMKVDRYVDEEGTFSYKPTPEGKERVRAIHYHWENKMNYENSEFDEHYTLKNVYFQKIKIHCNFFKCFSLLGNVLVIAHGKMASVYSILTLQWIEHFSFEAEIVTMFRSTPQMGQMTILLASNKIEIIRADRKPSNKSDQEPWIYDPSIQIPLPPGKITTHAFDFEENLWILFLVKNDQKCSLLVVNSNKVYDISSQIDKFGEKSNIFFLYSVNEKAEFLLQYNKRIKLYELSLQDDIPEEELKQIEEAKNAIAPLDNQEEAAQPKKKKKGGEQKVYPQKVVATPLALFSVPELRATLQYGVKFRLHKKNLDDDLPEKDDHKDHHKDDGTDYLIVGDGKHIYNIDLNKQKCVNLFEDQNCIGIYCSDNQYLYSLCHRSGQKRSGFRLYDIENVVESGKDFSYLLTSNVQVGCQGQIDYSPANQRLVFQASYEKLEVVPVLHRNSISYMGMRPRYQILATKAIDGRFCALSFKGQLYSWDMINGKMLDNKAPKYSHLSEYEIYRWDTSGKAGQSKDKVYRKEWYSKILLRKKTPVENFDEKTYFGNARNHSIKGQISYIDKQAKEFYEFKVIEIVSEREVKEHLTFIHPYYKGIMQYIYFSSDLTYMYERLQFERQFLYTKKDNTDGTVSWHLIHRFNQIPLDLMNISEYPFVFTPNFTKYIDIDNSHTYFIIRSVLNNEEIIGEIPHQLMSAKNEKVQDVARRFKWIDENTFLVINNEGLERLIDITDNFKEIQFNSIPLYDPTICTKYHYLLDSPALEESQVLERLQRKYQNYKSAYYLWNKRDQNGRIEPYHLQQALHTVDYRINNCIGRFVTDLSFSFLHWILIEQLGTGKITVEQIDHEQIEHLFYNILPGGNTILHKLHDKGELIEKLMRLANFRDDKPQVVIHVPFLQNMDEKSPIHLCSEHKEYRYINIFLECLQAYPIDHHSRSIADEYHTMIEHKLPALIPYLDSRVKQTASIAKITKGMLNVKNFHHVSAASFWHTQEDIDQLLQPAPIEQDIKLTFLDMPQVHDFVSDVGQNFFQQLADTDDMRLFETHAVKKLIEFKWPLIFEYTVKRLFLPFLLYLALYLTLMHYIFYLDEMTVLGYIVQAGVVILSFYLLGIEVYQVSCSGPEYFTSFWNYLDIIPPIFLLTFLGFYNANYFIVQEETATMEASIQATISLLIWLKMLYFLRIFNSTGYLIRIIIEVVVDMRHFLFILLLTFVAFGDAMYNINTSNKVQFINDGYIGGILYVYRMVLGDFSTDQFGDVAVPYMWILFLLCTVLNMIIMLNLLIAIISESFARINSEKDQASYQEKASFIAENLYLVPKSRREQFCFDNRYLLFAVDVEEELAEHEETVDEKLDKLKAALNLQNLKVIKKINKRINLQEETVLKAIKAVNSNPEQAAAQASNVVPHQH